MIMYYSKEILKKKSEARMGHFLSEETKKKISETQKGKKMSVYAKINISEGHKGIKHSEQWKLNHSKLMRKRWMDDSFKNKMISSRKGIHPSEASKLKMKDGFKRHAEAILKYTTFLRSRDFKTLNGDWSPKPDIIARKNGKIYAYEIELKPEKLWNKKKYENVDFFDEIIWLRAGQTDLKEVKDEGYI
jgi:hypothetical protein